MEFFSSQVRAETPEARLAQAIEIVEMSPQDRDALEALVRMAVEHLDRPQEAHEACTILANIGLHRICQSLPSDKLEAILQQVSSKSTVLLRLAQESNEDMSEEFRDSVAAVLEMILLPIPAGPFRMGARTAGEAKERPQHLVDQDRFYIARYPVTNAQYYRFIRATGHREPKHWKHGAMPIDYSWHPVVNVSWFDAYAYAEWAGLRMVTEAEWEKTASWNLQAGSKRQWPWGDHWDPNRCNSQESNTKGTSVVGRYSPAGDSFFGAADMAGNVWEWCQSLYQEYPYWSDDGREDPQVRGHRILRGGSWCSSAHHVRCTHREFYDPGLRSHTFGFRVAL